ncbi:MAG: hypothetical protein ACRDJ2_13720, partial [Actinomycetota bacterium]
MATEQPIACTLSAAELPTRTAEMAAIGKASLLSVEVRGRTAVLRFRASARPRVRLEAIVAAEAECCAFLTMELRDRAEVVELTALAPEGAEPV